MRWTVGFILAAALASVWLAGCASTVSPTSQATAGSPTAQVLPTQPPVSATAGPAQAATPFVDNSLSIAAADGLQIKATFYSPANSAPPWPGVLLLHMLGGTRQDWNSLAEQLSQAGYAALAIDMRGHGQTGGSADWQQAPDDIQRAWNYLASRPDIDPQRTAIVGASIGANLALVTAAAQPTVRTVVLLSAGLDYHGITTSEAMQTYGDRPVLLVASQEDSYAAQSTQQLKELASGEASLEMYTGAGHGTAMFTHEPGLAGLIIAWLDQHDG